MPELTIPLWLIQVLGGVAILSYMIAEGVRATPADVAHLFYRPGLLARSILAALILVPICAVLLVVTFNIPPALKAAVVLMAISPAPPLGLRRAKNVGNEGSYAVSLQVAMCLLAIVSVPATLALLDMIFSLHLDIPPFAVARTVLVTQILPLAAGMAIRRFAPQAAEKTFRLLVRLPDVLLLLAGIAILIDTGLPLLRLEIGWTGAAVVAMVTVFALGVGYWLGGPVLAVVSAARYPGLALIIALRNFPRQGVGLMIIAYTIISALVILALLRFVAARRGSERPDS